mmetsp:Transcript_62024/g.164981  ORF Transcript_62024/g.164981 Transcript_62024/m.164981 type:complete len:440 (+) Transcript_62024:112-1431(+)
MGSPLVGRLKTQLSRLAGDPEGLYVTAENLKRLLRQLDPSSAIISDEGLNVFVSVTPKESNGQISVGTFVDWLYEDSDFGLPEMQEKSPSTIAVFWSNHQTPTVSGARRAWLARLLSTDPEAVDEEAMNIKASMPPFNNSKKMELPKSLLSINVPVYGPNIPNSVMKIFEPADMRALAQRLSCRIPSYVLNRVVQSKMPKVVDLVNAARSIDDIAQRNGAAIDKLESFVKGLLDLKPADVPDHGAWTAFVNRYAGDGWAHKLHFDHLLDNFGFDKEASDVLRKIETKNSDGETVTLEHHAFRWLSKAFAAYGVEGCMTDVVNLIFAMMGIIPKDLDEGKIAEYIDSFRDDKLRKKDFSELWVPNYFVMDAEVDDSLTMVILSYVHEARGTTLQTFVQLPSDESINEAAATLEKLNDVYVYRDPEARNQKAVLQNFGMHH